MKKQILKKMKIFISTIILFLVGFLKHNAYEFTGKNFLVGLITPANESIFEHLKLAFFPILMWWILFYLFKKEKYSLDKNRWFLGCLVSLILSIIVIPGIHYFVKYGIGKELVAVDIISLYIAIAIGQFTGYYVYNHSKNPNFVFSFISIFIMVISFITLTICPPKLPMFKDNKTNTYGMNKE